MAMLFPRRFGTIGRRWAVLAGLGLSSLLWAAAPAARPNFLVILTDDQGYGDVSLYRAPGAGDVRTPQLERLAAGGMLFTHMRANATVCSPTRAALLTGRYPDRAGVPGVIRTKVAQSFGFLNPSLPTLASLLGGAGYHTALVGKWHLGLRAPNLPNERGFAYFHGFLGDMMDSYTTHRREGFNYMRRNAEVIDPAGHATDLFTDWACTYLQERAAASAAGGAPFFLYLAYNAPHFPIEPPAEWLARVQQRDPGLPPKRAANVALVEHLDDRIGRVLDTLQATGLDRTTVVFFTSDNGGSLPHAQNNDPWRGGKQSHFEGGLRVPFLVRWPGVAAPGARSAYPGLTFDIFATCLEAAGMAAPAGMDATSLLPALRGAPGASEARELYFVRREGGVDYGGKSYEALIRGDWKLLQNDPYSPLQLYHLKEDPQETTNLAARQPGRVREMAAALARHLQRGGRVPWQGPEED